jgi:hypothetical protein
MSPADADELGSGIFALVAGLAGICIGYLLRPNEWHFRDPPHEEIFGRAVGICRWIGPITAFAGIVMLVEAYQ